MAHHACQPIRIGGPRMYNPGNFFVERPRSGAIWLRAVQVIQRGFATSHRLRRGKSSFMAGIIRRQQNIGFRHVLKVHKTIGLRHSILNTAAVLARLISIQRPARSVQPSLPGTVASCIAIISDMPHAQAIAARRWSIDAWRGGLPGKGVPIRGFIAGRQGAHRLRKQD